ncbi:hypothetical protein OAS86_02475 [Gammaproteobacteria bacterium]|nr:hypothetical protein [Gammaproteobacteria bacterium]
MNDRFDEIPLAPRALEALLLSVPALVVYAIAAWLLRDWLIDDAGISIAYAFNLFHGQGWVAQPGDVPIEGFSNPLWTLLLSPIVGGFPNHLTLVTKLLSWLCVWLTFASVVAVVYRTSAPPLWRWVAVAATLLLALLPPFAIWSQSGLENPLYAWLVALLVLQLQRYAANEAGAAIACGLIVALLALTRPDGLIFIPAFAVVWLLSLRTTLQPVRALFAYLLAMGLPLISYLTFRQSYFGEWLANTWLVKGGPGGGEMIDLLTLRPWVRESVFAHVHDAFSWRGVVIMPLVFFGALIAVARRPTATLALLVMFVGTLALVVLMPPDWMGERRFATPFFTVLAPLTMIALGALCAIAQLRWRRFPARLAFVALAVVVLANSAWIARPRLIAFAADPTAPFADISSDQAQRFNHYRAVLIDDGLVGQTSLLSPDAGGNLVYGRSVYLDMAGLVNRDIAIVSRDHGWKGVLDHVFTVLRPSFIRVHDSWAVASQMFDDPRFIADYVPIVESRAKRQDDTLINPTMNGDYLRRDLATDERLDGMRNAELPALQPFPRVESQRSSSLNLVP